MSSEPEQNPYPELDSMPLVELARHAGYEHVRDLGDVWALFRYSFMPKELRWTPEGEARARQELIRLMFGMCA